MNFQRFALGLILSFGLAWGLMVLVPFFKMGNLTPASFVEGVDEQEGLYHPKTNGRVANGEAIYAANGCYQCHTQVARPSYAGNDMFQNQHAGLKADEERGDTRRESNQFDYMGSDFAQIGVERVGPDLINLGRRMIAKHGVNAEKYLYLHLYNPRLDPLVRLWSNCPPNPALFKEVPIEGNRSEWAVDAPTKKEGYQILPGQKARALVSYLLSLQHDDEVPDSMNYGDKKNEG